MACKHRTDPSSRWTVLFAGIIMCVAGAMSVRSLANPIGSIVLFGAGFLFLRRWYSAYKRGAVKISRYRRILAGKRKISIAELARTIGLSEDTVTADLYSMMADGQIPAGRFLDGGKYFETFIRGEEPPAEPEANKTNSPVAEGRRYIKLIRQLNDDLLGEVVSDKLFAMEGLLERIFNYIERHPEKLPEIRRLMEHHIPLTIKLVNSYKELDVLGDGAGIETVKDDIHKALDTVNKAFSNLLGSLFDDITIDVTTDIKVLKTILSQDGLLDNGDFKLKAK